MPGGRRWSAQCSPPSWCPPTCFCPLHSDWHAPPCSWRCGCVLRIGPVLPDPQPIPTGLRTEVSFQDDRFHLQYEECLFWGSSRSCVCVYVRVYVYVYMYMYMYMYMYVCVCIDCMFVYIYIDLGTNIKHTYGRFFSFSHFAVRLSRCGCGPEKMPAMGPCHCPSSRGGDADESA